MRSRRIRFTSEPFEDDSRDDRSILGVDQCLVRTGISDYLSRVCREIEQLDPAQIEKVSELIEAAYDEGRFVFICGNGGSGANASHLCEDLAKCTLRDFENQKRLKVLSLTDNTAGIMAWANDEGYDRIFLEQLKNLASPGDLLLAISGSGNSPNILKAVAWANEHGLTTVGITGFSGGKLKTLAHHNLHAAIDDMGIVESLAPGRLPLDHRRPLPPFLREGSRSQRGWSPGDRMAEPWVLGIEIGGTKLQLGIGHGQGTRGWLSNVSSSTRPVAQPGILDQIQTCVSRPARESAYLARDQIEAVGIGFGGPVDAWRGTYPKVLPGSGLGRFPSRVLDQRASGRRGSSSSKTTRIPPAWPRPGSARASGHSPLLYMTVGSGIGGALIVDRSYLSGLRPGCGRDRAPASARQHVLRRLGMLELEQVASGWAIASAAQDAARRMIQEGRDDWVVLTKAQGRPSRITAALVAEAAPKEIPTRRRSWIAPGRPSPSP